MAWKCDVCGKGIHLKKINGKNYPIRCPLEKFKNVKTFYTFEFKQMVNFVFFDDFVLSNNPDDLELFSNMIPEITPILDYVKKVKDDRANIHNLYTKTLIIQSSLESFFSHFNRFLIHAYDDNKIHFVDSVQFVNKEQFNYLWLSPTTLRECYFREGRKDSRFKSMTELGNPSLVIYPLGTVQSIPHGGMGDILLDLITHRQSMGKPTWIVKSKDYNKCAEINSSENLRAFITRSSTIPTVSLDDSEELLSKESSKKTDSNRGSYNL